MIDVPKNDHGAIYVLQLNRPAPDGLDDKTDAAMMEIFGNIILHTNYVDTITPEMLVDMNLPDLIRDGYDISVSEDEATKMRGLIGTVILVMSAAFGGNAMTINLPSDVRLVTVLRETATMTAPRPITTDSALGTAPTVRKKPSDAAMSGKVATYTLLVLFALVAVMIWVAG